jgi:A/G-specific adenine glycosylase
MRWTPRSQLQEEALPGSMEKVLVHALGDLPKAPSGNREAEFEG